MHRERNDRKKYLNITLLSPPPIVPLALIMAVAIEAEIPGQTRSPLLVLNNLILIDVSSSMYRNTK